eukprot:COSAG02_NODE_79_length_40228_cov_18.435762_20_plen_40_part_00
MRLYEGGGRRGGAQPSGGATGEGWEAAHPTNATPYAASG